MVTDCRVAELADIAELAEVELVDVDADVETGGEGVELLDYQQTVWVEGETVGYVRRSDSIGSPSRLAMGRQRLVGPS